jgi:hypothetical protein
MREVVDEARGNASERRLAFLLHRIRLQRREAIGHQVERVAELRELVVAVDLDALLQPPFGECARSAHQIADRTQERASPE